jgi:K+ transporter
VPSWALVPLVVLVTAATVIAFQAVITGASCAGLRLRHGGDRDHPRHHPAAVLRRPAAVGLPADRLEAPLDLDGASYFLSTIDLRAGDRPSMPRWRTQLFLALTSLTADAARAFELPSDRTVVIGSRISV